MKTKDASIYVADARNHRIRKISPAKVELGLPAVVTTVAGTEEEGYKDGEALYEARFDHPGDVLFDDVTQLIYVADYYNHCILVISSKDTERARTTAGVVVNVVDLLAGTGAPERAGGRGADAQLYTPYRLYKSERSLYGYNRNGGFKDRFPELILTPGTI